MNPKIIVSCLIIILILIFGVGTASALSNSGGGDWKYYREITVKENSGKTLSDYQVFVELNPSNFPDKAKMDGSDLRFAEDGKEFSYWIEDYDAGTKTARIWMKVPSIPANGEVKIKMFYGNDKAGSVSDGDATFEFFDDFESGNLNKWSTSGGAEVQSTSVYQGGDAVRVYNPQGTIYRNFSTKPIVIEWFGKFSNRNVWGGVDGRVVGTKYRVSDSTPGNVLVWDGTYHDPGMAGDSNWHRYKIIITSTETKYYYDGNLVYTTSTDSTYDTMRFYTAASYVTTEEAFFDQTLVRKYTSSEPINTFSKEFPAQKAPSLTLTKSAFSSAIQAGETTTISIRVENTGSGGAIAVEVTDAIPTGFKIISGSKSESFDKINQGDYRTFEYTLKATGSGKFTCDPATATYKDADGNSYSAASNSVSIQVGGEVEVEVPVGTDSDGDGWSDEKEREMGTNPYSVDSDGDGLKDPEDPNPTVPEEKKTPGFQVIFAFVGLLAVVYLFRRRG